MTKKMDPTSIKICVYYLSVEQSINWLIVWLLKQNILTFLKLFSVYLWDKICYVSGGNRGSVAGGRGGDRGITVLLSLPQFTSTKTLPSLQLTSRHSLLCPVHFLLSLSDDVLRGEARTVESSRWLLNCFLLLRLFFCHVVFSCFVFNGEWTRRCFRHISVSTSASHTTLNLCGQHL